MEKNAPSTVEIVAELIGVENPIIRSSCYAGTEICWQDGEEFRTVTFVDGMYDFCYTKNPAGLNGDWIKKDYWFLYLSC